MTKLEPNVSLVARSQGIKNVFSSFRVMSKLQDIKMDQESGMESQPTMTLVLASQCLNQHVIALGDSMEIPIAIPNRRFNGLTPSYYFA